jgi:hypothetical protein
MAFLLKQSSDRGHYAWPRKAETGMTLFEWLAQVCRELGWGVMRAHEMLDDTRWSDMYEQGLAPAQAAARAREQGLV